MNRIIILVVLLTAMLLSVTALEARWMTGGYVTYGGSPLKGATVVIEVLPNNFQVWMPAAIPGQSNTAIVDQSGYWSFVLDPSYFPQSAINKIRATVNYKGSCSHTNQTKKDEQVYEIANWFELHFNASECIPCSIVPPPRGN